MEISEKYSYKLRFRIDDFIASKYIEKWLMSKRDCESGENKNIIEKWISYCKLESNRSLPYLDRAEGGIGGDDNNKNKQIRFRSSLGAKNDNDIVIDEIHNGQEEKWTYDELFDLIYGFVTLMDNTICEECVNGCIEMYL